MLRLNRHAAFAQTDRPFAGVTDAAGETTARLQQTIGHEARSRANFVRQFKRYFGLSPSEYRKRAFTLNDE